MKGVKQIKKALRRYDTYVYALDTAGTRYRIIDVRDKHGVLQGKKLNDGRWVAINPASIEITD